MIGDTQQATATLGELKESLEEVLLLNSSFTIRMSESIKLLSRGFGAEIGTIYLLNDQLQLEVCSSCNFSFMSVPNSRFKVGEGVIGYIAASGEVVCTPNLTTHPSFVYRPGIEDYAHLALLGAPIKTDRGIVGVLVVQNPLVKPFDPWQQELLNDIMSAFNNVEEFKLLPIVPTDKDLTDNKRELDGVGFCTGIAMGRVYVHKTNVWREVDAAKDVRKESHRLKNAVRHMINDIDQKLERPEVSEVESSREVLESYRMIASDRTWIKKIQENIMRGLTAEAAVQKVRRETREAYTQIGDKNLRARLSDLEDLANRLLVHVSGENVNSDSMKEPFILVARHLGPAELLDYDRRYLKGVILEEGIHTSHVAIVARALDIPVIGRVANAITVLKEGSNVIIDGGIGKVILNPSSEQIGATRKEIQSQKTWQKEARDLRDQPCVTSDGVDIKLSINAGLLMDLDYVELLEPHGVGLYRTEIPFMMRSHFPNVKTQTELYRDVIENSNGRPVNFRTLDIGGDKVVPYLWHNEEENPALGWRAIRVCLDRPSLMRQQARALIKASAGKELRIMFPMIATAQEFYQARTIVLNELEKIIDENKKHANKISFGIMMELPSAVWELDKMAADLDFISVGTNDLFQFFYACDRTNPKMSHRYDNLSESFLNLLATIQEKCHKFGIKTSVCGEMASHPISALALMALGYHELSVTPSSFVKIKKAIIMLNLSKLQREMWSWMLSGRTIIRENLENFAKSEGIIL